MSEVGTGNQTQTEATKGRKSTNPQISPELFMYSVHVFFMYSVQNKLLTQFAIAEALLLHLALEGPHLLEARFLIVDILSEALQLLLFRGLLLLTLLLLLQVTQALLLETADQHEQRSA